MFSKVLVANRGEIALRIIRALRELDIPSVAVYSEADANALHVRFADEAVCIGPPSPRDSYLNIPSLISAAEVTHAEAIHPGYGFLAESAEFADVCGKCGFTWIGPSVRAMQQMGDKIRARSTMADAGVPVLPGSGVLETEAELRAAADRIGFPVILKAAAGGGGRGMKIIQSADQLVQSWNTARAEAVAAFGNPDMYMERFCVRPRHIEMQVIGDKHGHYAHFGERECSIQRRHQKLIEEAPSVTLTQELRDKFAETALAAVRALEYTSLGTLEFLLDSNQDFYFMEMNTRLQVEHTVTEMVFGVDLVQEQVRVAAGEPLSTVPDKPRGHSVELRITAEDPETFAPQPGVITGLNLPGGIGVRVDTHIYEGYRIPPNYDSLLAKLIVHAPDRDKALARLRRCLKEFVVEGVKTNLPFLVQVLDHPDFRSGDIDTGFVERMTS